MLEGTMPRQVPCCLAIMDSSGMPLFAKSYGGMTTLPSAHLALLGGVAGFGEKAGLGLQLKRLRGEEGTEFVFERLDCGLFLMLVSEAQQKAFCKLRLTAAREALYIALGSAALDYGAQTANLQFKRSLRTVSYLFDSLLGRDTAVLPYLLSSVEVMPPPPKISQALSKSIAQLTNTSLGFRCEIAAISCEGKLCMGTKDFWELGSWQISLLQDIGQEMFRRGGHQSTSVFICDTSGAEGSFDFIHIALSSQISLFLLTEDDVDIENVVQQSLDVFSNDGKSLQYCESMCQVLRHGEQMQSKEGGGGGGSINVSCLLHNKRLGRFCWIEVVVHGVRGDRINFEYGCRYGAQTQQNIIKFATIIKSNLEGSGKDTVPVDMQLLKEEGKHSERMVWVPSPKAEIDLYGLLDNAVDFEQAVPKMRAVLDHVIKSISF